MRNWKLGLAAAVVTGGLGLGLGAAEATPFAPAPEVAGGTPTTQVAYVCGPWGCHWRPGPRWRPYGYYGPPRPYYGPRPVYGGGYGYRRCWWRPTPWGPRRVCRGW